MGKDLYDAFPQIRSYYEQASDRLGYDTAKKSFEESADFHDTLYAQPLNYLLQCAITSLLLPCRTPDAVAGHSLGEYAALVTAGAFPFSQGLTLLESRSRHMQQAAKQHPGAMYAILKLTPQQVEEACGQVEGYVRAVNYNSPAQTVIAGETQAAETAAALCKEQGARVAKLAVSAAFHSQLMEEAADAFYADIQAMEYQTPTLPFYSNVTGGQKTSFDQLPSYLRQHLVSPVLFTKELSAMAEDGVDTFVEIGPGKALQGLVKKTLDGVEILGIQDCATLEKALALFQG